MSIRKWGPREMIRAIDGIARTFKEEAGVVGVAATGSFTRFEFPCGDIDVVIFHNGIYLRDASISCPPKLNGGYASTDPKLEDILLPNTFAQLSKQIPVDYIFVREDALWDCSYLQSLKQIERFTDFYLRIFTDPELPLVLFRANETRGRIRRFLEKDSLFDYRSSNWFRVRHRCYNPFCKPKQTWAEALREMESRKGVARA